MFILVFAVLIRHSNNRIEYNYNQDDFHYHHKSVIFFYENILGPSWVLARKVDVYILIKTVDTVE